MVKCGAAATAYFDSDEGAIADIVAIADAAHEYAQVAVELPLCSGQRTAISLAFLLHIVLRRIIQDGSDAVPLQILHHTSAFSPATIALPGKPRHCGYCTSRTLTLE